MSEIQIILSFLCFAFLWFIFVKNKPKLLNKECAWCGSKNIEFDSGKKGKFYWKEANKDGSQDKRFKGNYQLASYTSIYKCLECNAKTKFGYADSKNPSQLNKVTFRTLLNKGKGERKGKNWE